MSSSPSEEDAGSPLPSDVRGLQSLIAELNDDLMLQRTIFNSLRDLQLDADTIEQLNEAKAEINRLQSRLSTVRKAHFHAERAAKPKSTPKPKQKPATPSSYTMQSGHGDRTQRRDFAGGSGNASSSNPPQGAIGSGEQRPGTPSRKRAFSNANITPARTGHMKNRRSNEHGAGSSDSPSAALSSDRSDSMSVIDLTGDDDDFYAGVVQRDTTIAGQPRNHVDLTNTHRSSQIAAPNPFQSYLPGQGGPYGGTIRNIPERPSPRTAHFNHNSQDHVGQHRFDTPRMPGSFVDSDDENPGNLFGGPSFNAGAVPPSRPRQPGLPARVTANAAAEAARQRALQRAQAYNHGMSQQPPPPGYLPSQAPTWQTQLENDGFAIQGASQRPGYLNAGNPPLLQSNRFASGRNAYEGQASSSRDSLGNLIHRTNGYDFDKMVDELGNPLDSRVANYIHDVLEDPRKNAEEIQNLLSNIRPDMDIPEEERGETPPALKYPLYHHQQLALRWMTSMEEGTNKGGILADDMGLGKTISTLALMATRKSTTAVKTNLIVGPVALIKQWESEIRKKLKSEHRLSVFLYHSKKLPYTEMRNYDVVLTTYGKVAYQHKKYEQHVMLRKSASGLYNPRDDAELLRLCPLVHPKSKFYRVILDESQYIKNKSTMTSLGCAGLSAEFRWCLTGTPMMNGVTELFPYIRFLRIQPYADPKKFARDFGSLTAKKYVPENARNQAMNQLRIVLKAIMLRRMKNSTINGQPILTLPPKTENVVNCVFSQDEQSFYQQLESKSQVTFNKYLRAGTVGKNYAHVLVLLLRLRQACCHPHLNMDLENASAASHSDVNTIDMEQFAKDLDEAVVARLKEAEGFDCPICLDAAPDPTIFIPCGHDACAECFTKLVGDAAAALIQRGEEGGEAAAKCPECRGQVTAGKVITYSVFKKVHMPWTIEAAPAKELVDDEETESDSDSDDSVASSDDSDEDANSNGDLRDFIVNDDEETEYEDDENSSATDARTKDDDEFPDLLGGSSRKTATPKTKPKGRSKKSKRSKKSRKGKEKVGEVKPTELKSLRMEASKNIEARKKYMHYLKKNWVPSAKTTKVCELLREIQPTGEKTIIFSQWTALLDLLEIPLKNELGIKFARYDGGMSRTHRDASIARFIDNPDVKVLLVSLKAGNAGLNLTVASHVIICDPFWNPFIEMQAVDRAHRIGQQLPVQVHRILVKGRNAEGGEPGEDGVANTLDETVEDRIVKLQDQKRGLINAALDEGESRNLGRLSEQELRYLFGVGPR
ncbi:SNF2 family N-terminal domain-containing protein [Coniochaeta sp. 2T2.1]|nr:SNF2 family N-terminal domain-containing protein [Coniochaeta sp. 2T2.1]